MTELWIATGNRGKLAEFKTLLSHVAIRSQMDLPVYTSPDETGATFEDNARLKARSLKAMKPGTWVLGEDSGLEVDGLNKMPGVHSARYAGPKASDFENINKLLKMMSIRSANNRTARFKSVIVAFTPEGKEIVVTGELQGKITTAARGTEGFGYDPVFIADGQEKTLAEIGMAAKNKISHRSIAIRKLLEVIV
jgi:XTP/dITP diphosphohydrolase